MYSHGIRVQNILRRYEEIGIHTGLRLLAFEEVLWKAFLLIPQALVLTQKTLTHPEAKIHLLNESLSECPPHVLL